MILLVLTIVLGAMLVGAFGGMIYWHDRWADAQSLLDKQPQAGYQLSIEFESKTLEVQKQLSYGSFGVSKFWTEPEEVIKEYAVVRITHPNSSQVHITVGYVEVDDEDFDEKIGNLIIKAEERKSTLDALAPIAKSTYDDKKHSYYY